MKSSADVVVIGAGVIGCSTAYHLAKMGVTNVAVLEMDQVGAGTSGKSASMLSMQFGRSPLLARMAQYSYQRYMDFEQEFGTPIDFRKTGWISVASGQAADELRQHAHTLSSLGIRTEVLTPDEVKRLYPELNTDDIEVGTWGPDDGPFDPHMIMWGYIKRATEQGAQLYQGEKATGLRIENRRVTGVETTSGTIATRTVVNAAGPWAGEVGKWANIRIPLTNKVRTIVMTGALPDIPADRPFVEDETVEWYFRPETGGVLMGMGNVPTNSPETYLDNEMVDRIIDYAVQRVPVLEKASLLTAWSGVRPLTGDGLPIFGAVPSVEGFLLNTGWGGFGII
ncbi:MAG TPA: FAD-dependent oxidoreductase [Desulfosarcina sp.]|nr:FAD-dependent oxidoreductase [Desulfosarcina sp.]